MKRSKTLIEKRKEFVNDYINQNSFKPTVQIVEELSERLFVTERTVYNIIKAY